MGTEEKRMGVDQRGKEAHLPVMGCPSWAIQSLNAVSSGTRARGFV